MRLISWNLRHRSAAWYDVARLDADVALLQEACEPPRELAAALDVESEPWRTDGPRRRRWRTSIVGLGRRVSRLAMRPLAEAAAPGLGVSCLGSLAVARAEHPSTAEVITLVSMYAPWERVGRSAGGTWLYADASAHRLVSDLSALVGRVRGHRIIAAGDLNCLYGYGENGSAHWAARYQTVFDRFAALNLAFVGPQAPAGRQASPWPNELPRTSRNVPTYYTSHQRPETATRQLDFVFASRDIASRVAVRALNDPAEWGPSDHCQIEILLRDA